LKVHLSIFAGAGGFALGAWAAFEWHQAQRLGLAWSENRARMSVSFIAGP
jgi:hypothetical protein